MSKEAVGHNFLARLSKTDISLPYSALYCTRITANSFHSFTARLV